MEVARYQFMAALRPFSFVVAQSSGSLGVVLAWLDGYRDIPRAMAVLLAALLLQAGVNLINDHGDLRLIGSDHRGRRCQALIRANFRAGLVCFGVAALLAVCLVLKVGWPLLALCLLGLAGAYGYTGAPINYKQRGLGVVLVFWLMGLLMVVGSYLAISGVWSGRVALLSIPVSLLVSLLLLSNELRDYESDRQRGIATLVVRVGLPWGQRLYLLLLALAYLSTLAFSRVGLVFQLWPLLPSLLLVPGLIRLIQAAPKRRQALTRMTGRLLALFSLGYLLALVRF